MPKLPPYRGATSCCAFLSFVEMAKRTKLEVAIIDRVRNMRIKRGLSQRDLAALLNKSRGFISKIESPKETKKYNLAHLNKLAKELECSLHDFIPDKPL